jgi:preprotein translocase subunit SecA
MAQRDPLVEYQREGGAMFNAMMEAFMEEVVGFVFHLEVEVEQTPAAGVGVVAGPDGKPLQVGANRNGSRNSSPLVEVGPDPDGPGVEVHAVGDTSLSEDQLIDLIDGEPVTEEPSSDELGLDADHPVEAGRPQVRAKGLGGTPRRAMSYSAPEEDGSVKTSAQAETEDPFAGVGRNAACPCGSGKKFKMCHGRPGAH